MRRREEEGEDEDEGMRCACLVAGAGWPEVSYDVFRFCGIFPSFFSAFSSGANSSLSVRRVKPRPEYLYPVLWFAIDIS